jgi:signal peptidase II
MAEATSISRWANFRSPVAVVLFFGTAAAGVALDLWTKVLAEQYLDGRAEPIRFIPNWLHFTYTENAGAVFGLGRGKQLLFISGSVVAIGFLTYLFATSGPRRFFHFILGMLLAGAIGNMYDRIVHGHVRDMIHALPGIHWPDFIANMLPRHLANQSVFPWVFNVADSLLCVGVFLFLVYSFRHGHEKDSAPSGEPKPS